MAKPITVIRVPQSGNAVDHELIWSSLFFTTLLFFKAAPEFFFFFRCPFKFLTGIACPTCGITRAFAQLSNGAWREAFLTYPLFSTAFLFGFLYSLYGLSAFLFGLKRIRLKFEKLWHLRLFISGMGFALLLNWIMAQT